MSIQLPLSMLQPGDRATVIELGGGKRFQSRMHAMGVHAGACVEMIQAGAGPILVGIDQTRLAIDKGMAHKIRVELMPT